MNLDTLFLIYGIASLTLGLTVWVLYSSFGPESIKLIDPFEEGSNDAK